MSKALNDIQNFLDHFPQYATSFEYIKEEFMEKKYYKFLWRNTLEEFSSMEKTQKKDSLKEIDPYANEYVKQFLKQFHGYSDKVCFVYVEKYCKNYLILQEIIKEAEEDIIIHNLFSDDDTINHMAVFDKEKKFEIGLMFQLLYTGADEHLGGYFLYGTNILYYSEFMYDHDEDYIYTLERIDSPIVWYQNNSGRRDTNPFTIYQVRNSIGSCIEKGYIKSEYEMYKIMTCNLQLFFQRMFLKAQKYEMSTANFHIHNIRDRLIAEGVIKTRWKSEGALYTAVRKIYPQSVFQYFPQWLNHQSLDIYIPELEVGIEYQGIQHYQPVDFFGGEEGYSRRVELDKKKKRLCAENNITLIEWEYWLDITKTNILKKLKEHGF